jgi:hypothetical protein
MRTWFFPPKTALALLLVIGFALPAADSAAWWNKQWRLRTTVARSVPTRGGDRTPVETAIDFAPLIRASGVGGEFDPASLRVIESRSGRELPFAWRTEFDARQGRARPYLTWFAEPRNRYEIYFDTKGRGLSAKAYSPDLLPPENLLPKGFAAGWHADPAAFVRLGEQSVEIALDENSPANLSREVTISRKIDIREFAGTEMLFACDLLAEHAVYGAPAAIDLLQYRADGSLLLERAVDPRWLTVELAQGQQVHFSERGRFSPEAATLEVRLRFHCEVRDADTGQRVTGPESRFRIRVDRIALRPGELWPWPEESHAGFVEGALANAPVNRAFYFTGQRRLMFNGGSEGTLTAGQFSGDPQADHWGVAAGTLEFWCRPAWDAGDGEEHVLFEANSYVHLLQSRLRKLGASGRNQLEFTIADADGAPHTVRGPSPLRNAQWHHLAATWDFAKGQLQLFIDGTAVGVTSGGAPWPALGTGCGIGEKDRRAIPMQAFIGGDQTWSKDHAAEAAIDEFRVSDVVRYQGQFTPARQEFAPDIHTRALFHFDDERDGVHGGDDGFVRGHLACELDPHGYTAAVEVLRGEKREVHVASVARPLPAAFDTNRASSRLAITRPLAELPDPRYIEYRERRAVRTVAGKDSGFVLHVGGDFEPLLRSVTFRHADAASSQTALIPHWRSGQNVIPFSEESLRSTLATGARGDRDKALEVFRYALGVTNYFDGSFAEMPPNGASRRTSYASIKALNIYPLNQCGPLNYTLRKLFLALGLSSNDSPGTHHQFEQVYYRGSLRLFDLMPRMYWLERDNQTVASLRDVEEDPWLKLRQGDEVGSWLPGPVRRAAFGWPERPARMDFPLQPGERASLCWHNEGSWFEVSANPGPVPLAKLPPYYGNGAIVYQPVAAGDVLRDSLIYRASAPYIFSDARVAGRYAGRYAGSYAGAVKLSLSFDEGRHWTEVWQSSGADGSIAAGLPVAGRYAYWLKLELAGGATVSGLSVRTALVVAPLSLPLKLGRGDNRISFTAEPASAIETECRWVERYRTDLGFGVDAITYYMDGDASLRNLVVVAPGPAPGPAPGNVARISATAAGRPLEGRVSIEGLPDRPVRITRAGESATVSFVMPAAGLKPGDIRWFDVVLREGNRERRVPVQLLAADAALVAEAESANELSGAVSRTRQPGASGGAVAAFSGAGTLEFRCAAPKNGNYAMWLRARWQPGGGASMKLGVDGAAPRALHVRALIGLSDWTDPSAAQTKMYAYYGEQYAHWAWYRIPDVELSAGAHQLSLGAGAGAEFDALLILPQTDVMDRAAMNLFQNWNYAPWENPF